MGILIGSAVGLYLCLCYGKNQQELFFYFSIMWTFAGCFCMAFFSFFFIWEISVASTSHDIPLLLGNLTSFASGFVLVILGSLIRPDNFNFNITKQRIVVVEERIRSLIKEDNDESSLKKRTICGYKY